nr:tail fiber domain-containing protein [Brucella intermedia]
MTVRTIDDIFRDFVIDGVPATGPFNPYKPDIRDTLKALLEGISTFPDNRVIRLNNANTGTANNIVVTASVAIPSAAYQVLYILNVTQENTGPVTVSGAINRDLVTNTSAPVPAGYLTPGMAVLCIDNGSELRMLSYGDVEQVIEALAVRAEVAAEAAEAAAGNNWSSFDTVSSVLSANIPTPVSYLRTAGYYTVGDGGDALYKRVTSEPSHPGKLQSADGAWWEISSPLNVRQFGAKGDGTTDDEPAFSAAALTALSGQGAGIKSPNIPAAEWAEIDVPEGAWLLSNVVDTQNKEVVWVTHPGATFHGASNQANNLNGRLVRPGVKIYDFLSGIKDHAATFSIQSNRQMDLEASVSGFNNPNQLSGTNGSDNVSLYVETSVPGATVGRSAVSSYSSTGAVFASAMNASEKRKLRKGMIIRTRHASPFRAMLESWTDTTITVSGGWYLEGGTTTPQTPTGTDGFDINAVRGAWAINNNVFLTSGSYGNRAIGQEIGVQNTKGETQGNGGETYVVGLQVINLATTGSFMCESAYLSSGKWYNGFLVTGGETTRAFVYRGGSANLNSLLVGFNTSEQSFYRVTGAGGVEAGGLNTVQTVTHDFHTSGNVIDYDSRISASGGSLTPGQGSLQVYAVGLRPGEDNITNLGASSLRWATVYAASGAINTSDAREKSWIGPLTDAELRVARSLSKLVGLYRWREAVSRKGDNARKHAGVRAQDVKMAFEQEGLDGFAYGVLCYDEWDETPAEYNDEGKLVTPYTPAGNRYGIRHDELWAFVTAGFEARLSALELPS